MPISFHRLINSLASAWQSSKHQRIFELGSCIFLILPSYLIRSVLIDTPRIREANPEGIQVIELSYSRFTAPPEGHSRVWFEIDPPSADKRPVWPGRDRQTINIAHRRG